MSQEVSKSYIRQLGWIKHIGAEPFAEHYREPPPGTGHAVCKGGWCKIHHDKVNPLDDPFEHLRRDAPPWWVLLMTGLGTGLGAAIGGAAKGKEGAKQGAGWGSVLSSSVGALTAQWK